MSARSSRVAALLVLAAGAALVRCTLLVDFVDQAPDTCDGACDAAADAVQDVTLDTTVKDSSAPDVHDAGEPDVATLCKGKGNGWYCGFNGLNGVAPSKDDLVECRDAGVFMLTLCDAGCLAYPNGVPDRCNGCPSMKDGTYCGSQLPGSLAANAEVLVLCTKGQAIIQQDCAPKTCAPGPGTAVCK